MNGFLFSARDIPKAMLLRFALKHRPADLSGMSYEQLEYLGIDDVYPPAARGGDILVLAKGAP
ncbi:hypothetical protein A6F59_16785 [Prescottella equi]|nr:hypothetical protein A6F59_16785 [Prescottella equi]